MRKYLLDENVNPLLKKALLQRASDMVVWCVGDPGAPPLHTIDPDILLWCEAKGFTLVTKNRTSMPSHLQEHLAREHSVPGIFILKRNMSMEEIIEELVLIWEIAEPDEYMNELKYLPIS